MASAILITDRTMYKVNHRKISPSIKSSHTYTGERWPVVIDKIKRSLVYTDDFGAKFQLDLPDDPDNQLIWDLLECENLKVYHDTNKTRFKTPPGRNNYYVRLVFSNPEFNKRVQLLFRYNIEMTPINLGKEFFTGEEFITFINYPM